MSPVRLARIDLFPVKSFDSVTAKSARLLPSGGLENDRRFALFDAQGKFINGKGTPLVHALNLTFDDAIEHVTIATRDGSGEQTYSLAADRPAIESRLADRHHFGMAGPLNQFGDPDVALLLRVMRMRADGAEHVGESIGEGDESPLLPHARGDRHHAAYVCGRRARHDRVEILAEIRKVEMAVTIDEHG